MLFVFPPLWFVPEVFLFHGLLLTGPQICYNILIGFGVEGL
jgi:hypothetical protein